MSNGSSDSELIKFPVAWDQWMGRMAVVTAMQCAQQGYRRLAINVRHLASRRVVRSPRAAVTTGQRLGGRGAVVPRRVAVSASAESPQRKR